MEDTSRRERSAHTLERVGQNMGDTISTIVDKLAGKESNLRLSFDELTLDMGRMKVRLNGAVVLDVVYSKEADVSGTTAKSRMERK